MSDAKIKAILEAIEIISDNIRCYELSHKIQEIKMLDS